MVFIQFSPIFLENFFSFPMRHGDHLREFQNTLPIFFFDNIKKISAASVRTHLLSIRAVIHSSGESVRCARITRCGSSSVRTPMPRSLVTVASQSSGPAPTRPTRQPRPHPRRTPCPPRHPVSHHASVPRSPPHSVPHRISVLRA
jgi:hypothetical protein